MKYWIFSLLLFLNCTSLIKKEPVEIAKPENPLIEKVSVMISSFSSGNEVTIEPKKGTERSKLTFVIEQLENEQYLKLDFAIIPIKDIVRFKATVTLKRFNNRKEVERVTFEIATSDREEFVNQLKNILGK